ncbi:MAG: outer membrane protein [Flavobacteriales bacterium]|jgi:outer membrane protein
MKTARLCTTAIGLIALGFTTNCYADRVLGLYAGGGIWSASLDGSVGADATPVTTDELGYSSAQNTFAFVAFEHLVPVIPNIRLAVTDLGLTSSASISREFIFEGLTIPADAATTSEIDLSHTDVTLYYQILDNYLSFDIGLTGRTFDGFANIDYTTEATDELPAVTEGESIKLDGTIPMIYSMLQVDLPLTGWYAGASLNFIGFDGDSFSDIDAKIGYMTNGLVLDFGFDLGYREMSLTIKELTDLNADISASGPYASIFAHF